ncbi:MAG: 4Fe-4S binding protein [Thermodesulfobacteriota bacterium]|nr:4Fe-4S binding protein [Thermodesulfobacteriota bacterium]
MARINRELCTGCENCIPYCTVEAISIHEEKAIIDQNLCTECYVCIRNDVCPSGAIETPPVDSFIHQFQHIISDPTETTAQTGLPGRGTEEAKTNDVTGRFKKGEVGVCIDMGRPGIGCYLRDVEKVAMAVAEAGLTLEGPEVTPLAQLMTDLKTGKLRNDLPNVRFLSIIIEGKCPLEILPSVMSALMKVEKEIDTVFSLGLAVRVDEKGYSPVLDTIKQFGLPDPIRGKVNVGLGRPLVTD